MILCGGRIHNAPVSETTQFPYLQPQNYQLTSAFDSTSEKPYINAIFIKRTSENLTVRLIQRFYWRSDWSKHHCSLTRIQSIKTVYVSVNDGAIQAHYTWKKNMDQKRKYIPVSSLVPILKQFTWSFCPFLQRTGFYLHLDGLQARNLYCGSWFLITPLRTLPPRKL